MPEAKSKACLKNILNLIDVSNRHPESDVEAILTLKVLVTTIDARDTFEQDNYSTMTGEGGCNVSEVCAGTTSVHAQP